VRRGIVGGRDGEQNRGESARFRILLN